MADKYELFIYVNTHCNGVIGADLVCCTRVVIAGRGTL